MTEDTPDLPMPPNRGRHRDGDQWPRHRAKARERRRARTAAMTRTDERNTR